MATTPRAEPSTDLAAMLDRALALHREGDFAAALTLYLRAARAMPSNHRLWLAVGSAALDLGDLGQAQSVIRRALTLMPGEISGLINLSGLALRWNDKAIAEAVARRALSLAPDHPVGWNNLARARVGVDNVRGLDQASRRAMILQPGDPVALMARVLWASEASEPESTRRAALRGLCACPVDPTFLSNLGAALAELKQNQAAERAYRRALVAGPDFAPAWYNLGNLLERIAALPPSLQAYERAVLLAPGNGDYQFNHALVLLLSGDFQRGFEVFEHRWRSAAITTAWREPGDILWDGRRLNGETVMVWAEQGLGDTIHFSRYLQLIRERGGVPRLEAQPELVPFLRLASVIDSVHAWGQDSLPDATYHVPMMSLARLAGSDPRTVPPPLVFNDLPAPWIVRREDEGRDVGLVWAGNPKHHRDRERSLPLSALAPLLERRNIRFHVVQHGDARAEAETSAYRDRLILHPETRDFLDAAGLVRGLDLLITVDTALAHLAGTLGIATWLLLPHIPDWRWLMDREDSIWYPSVRLYRQDASKTWAPVIERISHDLTISRRSRAG